MAYPRSFNCAIDAHVVGLLEGCCCLLRETPVASWIMRTPRSWSLALEGFMSTIFELHVTELDHGRGADQIEDQLGGRSRIEPGAACDKFRSGHCHHGMFGNLHHG